MERHSQNKFSGSRDTMIEKLFHDINNFQTPTIEVGHLLKDE